MKTTPRESRQNRSCSEKLPICYKLQCDPKTQMLNVTLRPQRRATARANGDGPNGDGRPQRRRENSVAVRGLCALYFRTGRERVGEGIESLDGVPELG